VDQDETKAKEAYSLAAKGDNALAMARLRLLAYWKHRVGLQALVHLTVACRA
jgi:TPR repeat protein